MRLEMSTDILPLIEPGTYGTYLDLVENDIRDECVDDWKNTILRHGMEKMNEMLFEREIVSRFGEMRAKNGAFKSPKFYNYTNDWIEFDLIIPDEAISEIRASDFDDDFFKWGKENYGSHPGFSSFFPVEREKFEKAIRDDGYDFNKAVAMIIMWSFEKYVGKEEMEMYQHDFEDDILYELCNNDWQEDCEED